MVAFFDSLSDELRDWAMKQSVFFIASAPRFGKHVNLSPKGLPASTFTVLDPNTACYIDATGSGAETISHLYETNRATVMFCSFDKSPRIMRFFCTGTVIEYDNPQYETYLKRMGKQDVTGARAVIVLHIFKVQKSCGYGVPLLADLDELEAQAQKPSSSHGRFEDRKTLGHWAGKTVSQGKMTEYQAKNNSYNLDGMPALRAARRSKGEFLWLGDGKAYVRRLACQWDAVALGMVVALVLMLVVGGSPVLVAQRQKLQALF